MGDANDIKSKKYNRIIRFDKSLNMKIFRKDNIYDFIFQ